MREVKRNKEKGDTNKQMEQTELDNKYKHKIQIEFKIRKEEKQRKKQT